MAKETKKVVETGVAVTGQFSEKDIPGLLEKINAKISQLNGDQEKASRITGDLGNGFGKISSITDINTLRRAYAYVTHQDEAVNKFNDIFKSVAPTVKLPVLKEGDGTVAQWQAEILTQFREVTFKEELNKLKETKKVLEECLSEEAKKKAKLQNAGEALSELLGN
jgi:hypothetical protein